VAVGETVIFNILEVERGAGSWSADRVRERADTVKFRFFPY